MFRITRTEMITKTFRFPEDMLHELEALAQNNNVSMNNLVIQCCRYALNHLSPENEDLADMDQAAESSDTAQEQTDTTEL